MSFWILPIVTAKIQRALDLREVEEGGLLARELGWVVGCEDWSVFAGADCLAAASYRRFK